MNKIDGKQIAAETIEYLKSLPKPKKFFAVLFVGNNPASESFIKLKNKTAEELGIDFRIYKFEEKISSDKLRKEVVKISAHKTCAALLVQLPLPPHLNRHTILNAIPREKDVDVLSERALGAVYTNRNIILPPVIGTVIKILRTTHKLKTHPDRSTQENAEELFTEIKKQTFAIVGPGLLIGKPIATFLMGKTAGLHIFSRQSDLTLLKNADVVILGVGKANLVTPDLLKSSATIIDFGYDTIDGKITGDLDSSSLILNPTSSSIAFTPVPNGAGPVLIAQLFQNFFELIKHQK